MNLQPPLTITVKFTPDQLKSIEVYRKRQERARTQMIMGQVAAVMHLCAYQVFMVPKETD